MAIVRLPSGTAASELVKDLHDVTQAFRLYLVRIRIGASSDQDLPVSFLKFLSFGGIAPIRPRLAEPTLRIELV